MKRIILLLFISLPAVMQAQNPGGMVQNKSDTVVTKDPMDPDREYWIIHNMKGNIKAQGFLRHGNKDGVWREYDDGTGALSHLAEYKEGVLNGMSVSISTGGSQQTEETYFKGKKNGQRNTYDYFGRMQLFENYAHDILEGLRKTFYEDGKIQEESNYKNGKKNGPDKWYLQNGNLSIEYTYENGDLEGPAKVYDEKGNIKQAGVYKNNNEEGEWKEYQDSVLVKRIIYQQGKVLKEVRVKK